MNIWPSPDGTPESTSKKLTPLAPSSITTPMPAHWRACLHSRINRIRTKNRMKEVNQDESGCRFPILFFAKKKLTYLAKSQRPSQTFLIFLGRYLKNLWWPAEAGCGRLWPAVASCACELVSDGVGFGKVLGFPRIGTSLATRQRNELHHLGSGFPKKRLHKLKGQHKVKTSHTRWTKQWHPRLLCLTHQLGHSRNASWVSIQYLQRASVWSLHHMSFCRWSRLKPSLDQILHLCLAGRLRWENTVAPFWTGGYIRYIQHISSLITSQELHIFQQLFNNCSFEEFKDPLLSRQKSMLDYSYLDKKSNPLVLLISCFYWVLFVSHVCLMRFLFLSASKSESTGPLQTSSGSRLGEVSEGCGWLWMLCFLVQRQERTCRQSAESHREPVN